MGKIYDVVLECGCMIATDPEHLGLIPCDYDGENPNCKYEEWKRNNKKKEIKNSWIYKTLKTRKEKIGWAESELIMEQHKGVHTYHYCDCGKSCRTNMCATCWKEEIKMLKENRRKGFPSERFTKGEK